MVPQIICRVVRCAKRNNIRFLYQRPRAEIVARKKLVAAFPYIRRSFRREYLINPEIAFQLQMRPVKHRIPHAIAQRFRKLHKLVVPIGVTRDIFFVNTVRAHKPPLVMVAAQKQLAYILKSVVFRNLRGTKVAMIVDYRHFLCKIVVKMLCRVAVQHKLVIYKAHFLHPFKYHES